ncbi:MAG: RNA-guided pseudouridylation complex pseudouridine synthase subunit Cbf5 [Candidatus Bathyarchaeota archaeon]
MSTPPWAIQRDLITKVDEVIDPSYGCYPADRSIATHLKYGIINLDKPSGPSSHEVAAWVKRILKVDHAGHGGTLDPMVTGILPVALQEATKIIGTLLLSGKEYVCIMRLHGDIAEEKVRNVMGEFVGEILQRPPLRSSVQRVTRSRKIYYLTDFEFKDRLVLFRVACQSGTYIRKLVYDVGEALGPGAHMAELRRTRAGPFTENKNLISLYDLKEAYDSWVEKGDESLLRNRVMPLEKALELLPKVYVRDSAIASICHGAKLAVPGIAKLETGIQIRDVVTFFSLKGELVALGQATMSSEEMLERSHGIAADTKRVIMDLKTYPKTWQNHKTEKEPI